MAKTLLRVRGIMSSVKITPTHVVLTKGLRKWYIVRESITGLKLSYPHVIFYTANKKYRIQLWHGGRRIRRELIG